MSAFRQNYAVVIGINDYQNGISPLKTAVNDATVLSRILSTDHQYSVKLLLDQTATLSNLTALLQTELPQTLGADDRLLFYFAGHGIALDGEDGPAGYLVPQNALLGNPASFLRMQDLHDALTALPCRHLLAILDCCFAGAFRWASTRKLLAIPKVIHKERFDRFITDPAWQVITSAASDQQALDSLATDDRGQQGNHSPFAAALIQALQGAADLFPPAQAGKQPGDGVITATELYLYLRDVVEPATKQAQTQTPGLWSLKKHEKGEFIFLAPGHALNLPPAPPLDASLNPYRGLASFEEKDSDFFFGKTAQIARLAEVVAHQPLTVVLGASGSGKSSLVKAGLIPALKQGAIGKEFGQILLPMRPEASPLKSLNRVLLAANLPAVSLSGAVQKTLADSLKHRKSPHKVLLVIDQFEELVTFRCNDQEQQQFLQQLATALQTHTDRLRVVLTLRSDFEPQFRDTELEPYWNTARFPVAAMTREELRQAIEEPASKRVMYFDPPGLVDRLIDEVIQMPGALPLLSFTLSELYLRYLQRQAQAQQQGETLDRAITQADYDTLGGVTRSLTQRADQEYTALVAQDPAYAEIMRGVMLRMVAASGGELARRRVPLSELEYPDPLQDQVKTVIDRFLQARLLVSGVDADDRAYVEPAHDALVRGWQRLLEWLKSAQEAVLLQRRLTPAAEEWQSQQKNRYLWNADPRLDLLRQTLRSSHPWFNRVEAEFVRRSIQQKRKNTALRWGTLTTALLVITAISLVAQGLKFLSNVKTQAAIASSLSNTDSVNGLVAAIQAASLNDTRRPNDTVDEVAAVLLETIDQAREQNRIAADPKSVYAVAISADSQTIVSGGSDGTVRLWTPRGEPIAPPFQGHTVAIEAVAISADGKTIVSSDAGGIVRLWNWEGQPIAPLFSSPEGIIRAVAISADGQTIVSGDSGGIVRLWNREGQPIAPPFQGHEASITTVALSGDGQTIASGDYSGVVRLWNSAGSPIGKPWVGHQGAVRSVALSQQGQVVTGGRDGTVRLWNQAGQPIAPPFEQHKEAVNAVAISADGQMIVSGSDDETIDVVNASGDLIFQPFRAAGIRTVNSVVISADRKLVISGCGDGTIRLWDTQPNPINPAFAPEQDSVNTVAVSHGLGADGWIVTGGSTGTLRLWSLEGKPIGSPFTGHNAAIWAAAISPDNQQIASGDDDGVLRLWNREGPPVVPPIQAHTAALRTVAFSPDSQYIVTGAEDGRLRIWDRQGKQIASTPQGLMQKVWAVAISPDSQTIATGNDNQVQLWDRQGNPIASFNGHRDIVRSVVFHPNGQQILSGSEDRTLRLWNRQGQAVAPAFMGHEAAVTTVAFSPDGQTIASGSADHTIRLWTPNGNPILSPFRGHTDKVHALTFVPDGRWIVSASRDGTMQLLRISGWQDWLNVACSRLRHHPVLLTSTVADSSEWAEAKQDARSRCQEFWR
ncbi:caspase family protein [Phormidium tenue FACHB-886]|nr:caspase family protein [Phormidium tenue FACHB-886]